MGREHVVSDIPPRDFLNGARVTDEAIVAVLPGLESC